ncbi:tetratricopeptide repeat protein [Novosphingobium bradum]|uniref:Tetratricopeptide repeat protein n=1 Tax=Novosphingobium bradum TaxID=1737444 RepID=A0ABV7ITE2_9SPHN
MRFAPASMALSLVFVLTASMGQSQAPQAIDPRAAALVAQGRTALGTGNVEGAIDAYEAALAIQPGATAITLDLAEATRRQGLQGKALHYYREALERDPRNVVAISGEGAALLEKGAVEKAKRNLARLQNLCGSSCPEAESLAALIARGPQERVVAADPAKPTGAVAN